MSKTALRNSNDVSPTTWQRAGVDHDVRESLRFKRLGDHFSGEVMITRWTAFRAVPFDYPVNDSLRNVDL